MRVLHIAEAFASGTMTPVLSLSEQLSDDGHEVAIAYGIRPETPPDVRAVVDPRVELHLTPWKDRSLGAQVKTYFYLRRLVKSWRPDVVHLHSSYAGFIGAMALRRRVPMAYTPQGYSFSQQDASALAKRLFIAAERAAARRVDMIAASSADEAELARDVARAKRVTVVHNGISELDNPSGHQESPGARGRVIALGRIAPQRRPRDTVKILTDVSDLAEIAWIGSGVDPADVAIVREAGIEITGWVTREESLRQLASADVYLHWSAWDGHPLTVLEALAFDTIVIASNIGPNREILGEGQVFDSVDDAIAAIRAVITDPAQKARYLDSQRARREEFSARRMTASLEKLYAELAGLAGGTTGESEHLAPVGEDLAGAPAVPRVDDQRV